MSLIITALKWYVNGHVNETVDHRNFCRHFQQPGESFNDYYVSLCATSAWKGYSLKSILDQILEGFVDGEIIVDLQEHDLALATAPVRVEPRRLQSSNVQRSLTDPSPFTDPTPDVQVAQLSPMQGVVVNLTQQVAHSALPTA